MAYTFVFGRKTGRGFKPNLSSQYLDDPAYIMPEIPTICFVPVLCVMQKSAKIENAKIKRALSDSERNEVRTCRLAPVPTANCLS